MRVFACAAFTAVFIPVAASAQMRATDIGKAEIDTLIALGPVDHQGKVVDIGKMNLGVAVIHRDKTNDKPGDPVRGSYHDYTAEVYYILSGSGMLTTGGTLIDPARSPPDNEAVTTLNGPTVGGSVRDGYTRRVSAGDVVVIPPGVFHGWSEIDDQVTYISVRPDPDRVLPAGYVNPAIR